MSHGEPDGPVPGPRRGASAPRRREALVTVALVAGLLTVVGLVVVLDPSPDSGTEAPAAQEVPAATPTPTPTQDSGPRRKPRRVDRLPARERDRSSPTTQARPPALPTLAELDQRLGRRGLERVSAGRRQDLTFRVGTFNVLGASHTTGPKRRRGYASGPARLGPQLAAMEARGISVAGLQEFQGTQVQALQRRGGDWAAYPGLELGRKPAVNSVVWRPSVWERVRAGTTPVPYFYGNLIPMPHVLLRHRETGREVWFANYHNPADVRGNAAGTRQRALRIEAAVATRLGEDGTPVLVTGDFNDRAEFACPFSRLSRMTSADGARTENGRCVLPGSMFVDWIFGSPEVGFEGYLADRSLESRRLSDHPLISADATVPGLKVRETPGCRTRIAARRGQVWYCPA